jgi:hypothetical protein
MMKEAATWGGLLLTIVFPTVGRCHEVTRTNTILVWGALGAIAIAAIVTLVTLRALLVDSARSYLKTSEDNIETLNGTRMPCKGYFDAGFIVFYHRPRDGAPFIGRICRPIMSPDWVFYPNRDDVTR